MAVTGKLFGKSLLALFNKEFDWLDDDIRLMLTSSTYTPDQDAHDYKDDVTNEVVATGYTAGGAALAGKTITYTAGTNTCKLDADDVAWAITGTLTMRHGVVYDRTPATDATRPLLLFQSSSADISITDGVFTMQWHANGIAEFVAA